jgi:glycosyltransferase involved in cell wall biosynthesis
VNYVRISEDYVTSVAGITFILPLNSISIGNIMKVLMFGWEFPPNISGGLGTACYGLTKGLKSFEDVDLTFVVPKVYGNESKTEIKLIGAGDVVLSEESLVKQSEYESEESYVFDRPISAYITPEQYKEVSSGGKRVADRKVINTSSGKLEFAGDYGSGLFREISRYAVVASEIARIEPHDIIHAHDWLTYPAGIAAKKMSHNPLIIHVHSTEFDRSGENPDRNVYEIERMGMETADKIITVSDLTRNIVINRYHIDPAKIVTVHNAAEPRENKTPAEVRKSIKKDNIVTFLGRITYQKGPEYFVRAAWKVLQKMDNVTFVMAGSGDMMEEMMECVARLGIADRFHFTGFLKGDAVSSMFAMSDLYVMPSVSEPFGISTLEAIQSNVPVIISRQSGVAEVITHAIKVDFWDIDSMADAIYGILNYPPLGKYMVKNGRIEADKIKWIDSAAKVKNIYYQVASCKAS